MDDSIISYIRQAKLEPVEESESRQLTLIRDWLLHTDDQRRVRSERAKAAWEGRRQRKEGPDVPLTSALSYSDAQERA